MKKTVLIEILLSFTFAVLMAASIMLFKQVVEMKDYIYIINTSGYGVADPNLVDCTINIFEYNIPLLLRIGIPALIAAVADLAAIVIIAFKDFPIVKRWIDNSKAKRAAQKEQRAEAAKQARIEKLQAELDELKKDE